MNNIMREHSGDDGGDAIRTQLFADLKAMDEAKTKERLALESKSKELVLSPEDKKKIHALYNEKVSSIQQIPARNQRRIREALNRKRKSHNKRAHIISYEEINPHHPSYNEKYAKLIVDCYNDDVLRKAVDFRNQKIFTHELWKIQNYSTKQLQNRVKKIPHDVQAEIIQSFNLDPKNIASYKKEVKQKIIAAFNTYY